MTAGELMRSASEAGITDQIHALIFYSLLKFLNSTYNDWLNNKLSSFDNNIYGNIWGYVAVLQNKKKQ